MKANELMIGDWVKPFGSHKNVYAKIISITPDRIDMVTAGKNPHHEVAECIYPISLTPEILEKNGFEKWDGWYIYSLENFGIEVAFAGTILKIGGECGILELPAIMYVHQLQHALKLCRIKMEIEL